jgi:hypothetical protein
MNLLDWTAVSVVLVCSEIYLIFDLLISVMIFTLIYQYVKKDVVFDVVNTIAIEIVL